MSEGHKRNSLPLVSDVPNERIKYMCGDGDLYDYCADDPVNRVDRDGLSWVSNLANAVVPPEYRGITAENAGELFKCKKEDKK